MPSIPPTVLKKQASKDGEKAKLFNQYFASVFNNPNIHVPNERMSELNTVNWTKERVS